MRNALFLLMYFVFAISFGCKDKEKVQDEFFSVEINTYNGGYRILTCGDSDVAASSPNGELETDFLLPATHSGRCYRVAFEYLDGFETPEYAEETLVIGAPVSVEGEYRSTEGTELMTIKTNDIDGSYRIERTSDGVTVGAGPFTPGDGEEMHSFILPANPEIPGIIYKIYFGDVDGCTTPNPYKIELITGSPQNSIGYYACADDESTDSG